MRRQLQAEGLIAVGPGAHVLAVEPDLGVGHGTVEVDEDPLALVAGRNREMLAIPADALPRQLAGVARQIVAEGALDAPVMGNVQRSPRGVIERGRRWGVAAGNPRVLDRLPCRVGEPDLPDARPLALGKLSDPDADEPRCARCEGEPTACRRSWSRSRCRRSARETPSPERSGRSSDLVPGRAEATRRFLPPRRTSGFA